MAEGGRTPAHVVMIVGNDVTIDTRVRRMASTLARAGVRVTVLGLAPEGVRRETMLGEVRLIRVPVAFGLRQGRRERMARRRRGRIRIGYRTAAAARLARDRLVLRQREVAFSLSALPSRRSPKAVALMTQKILLRLRREVVRGRAGVQGRMDIRRKKRWLERDRKHGESTRFVSWRRITPEMQDYALAFLPVLDELAPDAIHAHDEHMVGIAALASFRARQAGRRVPWVYDAHEYVAGLAEYAGRSKRVIAAYHALEAEYIRQADRVVTVSPQLAEVLQTSYELPRRPDVHLNVPLPSAVAVTKDGLSIREAAGVPEGVPLMVYSGGVTSARGVLTAVEALTHLPGVHLAVVAVPHPRTHACRQLLTAAVRLGVANRLHLLEPVVPEHVVTYLSSADVGLIPLMHFGSHEVALTNKLFEYTYAGLPVVVSDCRAQREFVEEFGIGLVHKAGDAHGLARAVQAVLVDRDPFLRAREEHAEGLAAYSWPAQEQALWNVYRDLLPAGSLLDDPPPAVDHDEEEEIPGAIARSDRGGRRLLAIGPSNMAGQGWAWAKAVERSLPIVDTTVLALENGKLDFPADERVSNHTFVRDRAWQQQHEAAALQSWTHVLIEAGRPVLGRQHGGSFAADVPVLRAAGVEVGLVFHGSEMRNPVRHAATCSESPFSDPTDSLTEGLMARLQTLYPLVTEFDGPKFVSTPDLLDDVPGAQWLPVVVDTSIWAPQAPPLQREVPLVLHVPSNTALKGTAAIEEVLEPLVQRGLIEYRRLEGVDPCDMPKVLGEADIVLDQFSLGSYGVLACQAMAQGRVTVGHLDDVVRTRVPLPIPMIEATVASLGQVLEGVLADRPAARAVAEQGPAFVRELHDGRRSARVLAPFLGVESSGAW